MTWDIYIAFVLVSVIVIIVPGPNVTLIAATSLRHGTRAGLMALAGTTVAQALQVTLVALGLVWLVQAYSFAFEILRWVGAVYLIYLGIQAWRSANKPLSTAPSDRTNVRRGFLVGLANPKSLTFFAAFFPQFINPALPSEPQFALLAASYVVLALVLDTGYAVAGGLGKRFLATDRAHTFLGRISGVVLGGGGVWLALAGRNGD